MRCAGVVSYRLRIALQSAFTVYLTVPAWNVPLAFAIGIKVG
jgi:hypothetical protein